MTHDRPAAPGPRLPLALAVALLLVAPALEVALPSARADVGVNALSVAAGLLVLVATHRLSGTAVRWVAALGDAGALTLVAGLPRWWPAGADGPGGHPRGEQALALAALLVALLVLFVVATALVPTRAPSRDRLLLGVGLVAVAASAAASLAGPAAQRQAGSWADVLPLAAAASWAVLLVPRRAAGADPAVAGASSPGLTDPADPAVAQVSGGRLALLAVLGGAAPASLLVGGAPVTASDVWPVVVSCVLLAACSVAHLSWRARQLAALARERAAATDQQRLLVSAGQGLVQARTPNQVARAASAGAVQLLAPSGSRPAAAAVALGPPDVLELSAVHSTGLPLEQALGPDLGLLSDDDLALLRGGRPVLREIDAPGAPGGPGHLFLVLPLRSSSRALGVLLVAASRADLHRARPTVEAFALHVSLALDAVRGAALPRPRDPRPAGRGPVDAVAGGLRRGEFACHYQPVVDMVTGGVAGFEALVRWQHPARGLLLPGAFLPAVEDAGLLTALDDHLLVEACKDLVRIDPRPSGPYVSVNLSSGQLADERLAGRVQAALAGAGLPPWRLQLEVTEGSSLRRPEQTAATLARLRALRVRVAFDDFGTGQSSLSWLHQLPLDVVKIDRSFVERLPTPAGTRSVVAAVTALSHALGLAVIAEGVETLEQQHELVATGVRHAQGWLYARALPVPLARDLARAGRLGAGTRA